MAARFACQVLLACLLTACGMVIADSTPGAKVEVAGTDLKAFQCGKAVLVNFHGTLVQAPEPQGGDPATCDHIKITMSNITAVHRDAFKGMVNVHTISLWGNHIAHLEAGTFRDTAKLQHLMLGGNQFRTLPEGVFHGLKALTFLDFYAQLQLISLPTGVFDGLTSLEKLYMADTKLTEHDLERGLLRGPAPTLRHLSLGNNHLTRLPGEAFADMAHLTTLSLSSNKITQLPQGELEHLRALPALHEFVVSYNPLECCDIDETLPRGIVAGLRKVCPEKRCTQRPADEEARPTESEPAEDAVSQEEESEAAPDHEEL